MVETLVQQLDAEIERLTQARNLLANGTPFHTVSKAPGPALVVRKNDKRLGKRSPEVIAHMRAAQRRRYALARKSA